MTEPAPIIEGDKTILWREQEWRVPELAARQLHLICEPMERITEILRLQDDQFDNNKLEGEEPEAAIRRRGQMRADWLRKITSAELADLQQVVFVGLTRGNPDLNREEFDDAPSSPAEMLVAFYQVRRQSRFYEEGPRLPTPKPAEPATPGEAGAR